MIIDIEIHFSNNLPKIIIVGLVIRSANMARERLRDVFSNSQPQLPLTRTTINLAPADIPKTDIGLDPAIAAAILVINEHAGSCGFGR